MTQPLSSSISDRGKNVVTTSHPLAVEAGLTIFRQGGNAIDAALAAAITLVVVEPTGCGLGSDAFALFWDGSRLRGINGSGRSPSAWDYDKFASLRQLPTLGWETVTIPGAVALWTELSQSHGRLPFKKLFEPAIDCASNGFEITPIIAEGWQRAASRFRDFPEFARIFLPHGRSPAAGERFFAPEIAKTLSEIALTKGESFYRGKLASKIATCAHNEGSLLTADDLAAHKSEWVEPISVDYRDITLHELPPNGQGLAALVALGLLNHFELARYPIDSAKALHLQIEAMKIGLADIATHLADPTFMTTSVEQLLRPKRLQKLAEQIDQNRAQFPANNLEAEPGTVYLTTADQSGKIVSFIQSNYMGFGSGVVIPGTGISMQNRGAGFSLIKGHPNQIEGGKHPYQTIIPGFVTRSGQPLLSLGVMGGHMQAQGHLQMITAIFDYKLDPQAAINLPRWFITQNSDLAVEPGLAKTTLERLAQLGHRLKDDLPTPNFGGAQMILKTEFGYLGASDRRKDGLAQGC